MSRVIHFELAADNPERAIKFYSTVFGWKIDKWEGQDYWLATTGDSSTPGIDGAIMPRDPNRPPIVNTLGVDSLDDSVDKVMANGGTILEPKMPIPGVGYFAYCLDTEGNPFGLMQSDPSATM